MRVLHLPNGNLLIPAEVDPADDTNAGDRLHEIGPDRPEYGKWLAFAEDGEDPRPRLVRFTFPPGATAEEMARIIQEVAARAKGQRG